ncbi:MAG: hypothetical protein IMZ44_21305 [Planctomycetes bacterium]|nr:hypothetical protein [Planctomycetota bacterium]
MPILFAVGVLASAATLLASTAASDALTPNVDFGWIVGAVIAGVVVQAVVGTAAGLIVARRTAAAFEARLKVHDERLAEHAAAIDKIGDRVQANRATTSDLRVERADSERRAALEFASRGELSRLVADSTCQYRDLAEKIDALGNALHSRVTAISEQFREFRGRMEKPQ